MKNITSIVLFVCLSSLVFGQQNKFDLGLEGGPSSIFLRGNEIIKSLDQKGFGFSGGFSFLYKFNNLLALKSDIAFERKGTDFSSIATDQNANPIGTIMLHQNHDYLTLPLLLRTTIGNKIKFFFNAGPFLGFLLSAKHVVKATNYPTYSFDQTKNFKRFDYGLTTGIGITIPIKSKFSISFEIRNNLGLLNTSKLPVYKGGSIKTNSTNCLLGVAYRFGNTQTETK